MFALAMGMTVEQWVQNRSKRQMASSDFKTKNPRANYLDSNNDAASPAPRGVVWLCTKDTNKKQRTGLSEEEQQRTKTTTKLRTF